MDEPITVNTHTSADGSQTFTVDRWPRKTLFDDAIFAQANPEMLTVNGDTVTITVENGKAVYQLDRANRGAYSRSTPASLVSSRLTARDQRDAGERVVD